MIVKNEEANLPACLDSAADLFDEIIVVDTGSTDRTKEIALERGAKVFDFTWVDSFSAARNACLDHATGQWIFWLDADDRLDADNRDKLRALFASLPEENLAFAMKCRCPGDGGATMVDHIRLFRNDPRIRWRYRIHEQILPAVRATAALVRWLDVVIHHTGYVDPALRKRKLQRDLRLLQIEYTEQPHDAFTLFNLGAAYNELGEPSRALPLLRESLQRSHPSDSIVRKLYSLIAGCHISLHQRSEALAVCQQGQAICPDDAELLFLEAVLRTDQGDNPGAKAVLLRLLESKPGEQFASVADGLRGYRGRHQLAVVCSRLGETEEAISLWQAVLRERPDFLEARAALGELLFVQQRWAELDEQITALQGRPKGNLEAALLRGKALIAQRDFATARTHLEAARSRWPTCLPLLIALSHVLLQQDADPAATETVLTAILQRDPDNAQARHNLSVLRLRKAA